MRRTDDTERGSGPNLIGKKTKIANRVRVRGALAPLTTLDSGAAPWGPARGVGSKCYGGGRMPRGVLLVVVEGCRYQKAIRKEKYGRAATSVD